MVWSIDYNKSSLMCFELVSCTGLKNMLYKLPVSNVLKVIDLPKKSLPSLSSFHKPTGKHFDNDWEISDQSGLPKLKEQNG